MKHKRRKKKKTLSRKYNRYILFKVRLLSYHTVSVSKAKCDQKSRQICYRPTYQKRGDPRGLFFFARKRPKRPCAKSTPQIKAKIASKSESGHPEQSEKSEPATPRGKHRSRSTNSALLVKATSPNCAACAGRQIPYGL